MSTLRPRLELNFKTIFWLPARWWYGMLRHWNMYTSALWRHGGKVETLLFTCEPATVEPIGRVKNYGSATVVWIFKFKFKINILKNWVKWWSAARDFFQTCFKTNISKTHIRDLHNKGLVCFGKSLKEIHSCAPSFNPRHAMFNALT